MESLCTHPTPLGPGLLSTVVPHTSLLYCDLHRGGGTHPEVLSAEDSSGTSSSTAKCPYKDYLQIQTDKFTDIQSDVCNTLRTMEALSHG